MICARRRNGVRSVARCGVCRYRGGRRETKTTYVPVSPHPFHLKTTYVLVSPLAAIAAGGVKQKLLTSPFHLPKTTYVPVSPPPVSPPHQPRSKGSRRVVEAKLWFVGGLEALNLTEDARESIERVERRHEKRLKRREQTE